MNGQYYLRKRKDGKINTPPKKHMKYEDDDSDSLESDVDSISSDVDDTPEEVEDYFESDPSKIKDLIINILSSKFPRIKKDKICEVADQIVEEADESLLYEYTGAVPNDKRWKIGLEPKVVLRLEKELAKLREMLRMEEPSMVRIYTFSPLPIKEIP